MIIDFHTHVLPPQVKQKRSQYIDRDPCFALLYAKKEAKIATAEELIDSMDRAGIDVSVIVNFGWMTHELCTETNDYILESIARHPKRLVGFCTVQPQSLDAAIAEIERCAENGAKGIGELRPDIQLLDLEDEAIISPLMETIKKHRLILLTHASEPAGHDYPGKGIITPDVLYPFITHYPDVTIVCAHWGGGLPFYALMPEVKRRCTTSTSILPHLRFSTNRAFIPWPASSLARTRFSSAAITRCCHRPACSRKSNRRL